MWSLYQHLANTGHVAIARRAYDHPVRTSGKPVTERWPMFAPMREARLPDPLYPVAQSLGLRARYMPTTWPENQAWYWRLRKGWARLHWRLMLRLMPKRTRRKAAAEIDRLRARQWPLL